MSARYTGGLVYNAPGGWSAQFNGTTQYLRVSANTAIDVGSGDFTINVWALPFTKTNGVDNIFGYGNFTMMLYHNNTNWTLEMSNNGSSNQVVITAPVILNSWQYLTIVKSGTTVTLYRNAVSQSTGTISGSVNTSGKNLDIGANGLGTGQWFTGYISNYQLIKGTAVVPTIPSGVLQPVSGTTLLTCRYPTFVDGSVSALSITNNGSTPVSTVNPFPASQLPNPALGGAGNGVYTMSQYAALKAANLWPAYDPYYKNVTLNLHGNAGTALPFNTDASTNNFQVTLAGNTSPSNYTPFIANGYWSNYFDGSGDYLSVTGSALDASTTTDYTVEFWMYTAKTASAQMIYELGTGATNDLQIYVSATALVFQVDGNSPTATVSFTDNSWVHVACVKVGGTLTTYINGVGTTVDTGVTVTSKTTAYIGMRAGSSLPFAGYLSNMRVNRSAVYTSNFTPPTSPLTAITNTALLTCQSNRFIDNSTNAFTVTPSGNTSVNPYQPFTAPTGTSAYGSGYFDGSGDYLNLSSQNALPTTTQDFTVEFWAYKTSAWSTANQYFCNSNASGGFQIWVNTSAGTLRLGAYGVAAVLDYSYSSLQINAWVHIAYSRSGSSFALWVNGTRVATTTSSQNFGSSPTTTTIAGSDTGSDTFGGYISNFRAVRSTYVYDPASTTITVPTSPLTAITNTSLLTVQTNAPSQNNTFLDSSTNNFAITRNGNTTQGTFSPYGPTGYWSNYTAGSGSAASRVDVAGTSGLFGTNISYTIEGWFNYPSNTSGDNQNIIATNTNTFPSRWLFDASVTGGTIQLRIVTESNGTVFNGSTVPYTLGTWAHLAVVNDNTANTCTFYVNGVAAGTRAKISLTAYSTLNLLCNSSAASAIPFYVSNFRLTNNVALYSANFTPSTLPLTAVSGTAVLTFQNNRFIDNSASPLTLTAYGTNQIQKYTPFAPPSYYQPSVIGGSAYFDGSGDYFSLPSNSAFAFGTGDFTVDGWLYSTSTASASKSVFSTGGSGNNFSVYLTSTNQLNYVVELVTATGGGTVPLNTWTHIACSRSSGTIRLFINGAQVYSGSETSSISQSTPVLSSSPYPFFGYMSNMRVVKGTAVYTSAFTPPTAPVTAITNTVLLLDFTNAAIIDNAMMNDLETVGNAQISTSVKKYGTGSMYFDGTGDGLQAIGTPNTAFGTSDFTVEFWVYLNASTGSFKKFVELGTSGACFTIETQSTTNVLTITDLNTTVFVTSSTALSLTTWTHVAATRSGTTLRLFQNGIQVGSATNSTNFANSGNVYIGQSNSGQAINAYMDDLRITKGVARYTTNFTPPTSQVQDQ